MAQPETQAHRNILVLPDEDGSYSRRVMQGITAFARPMRRWHFTYSPPTAPQVRDALKARPDGIIGAIRCETTFKAIHKANVPIVNWASSGADLPSVRIDDHAVAAMAADYLIARGFRHLASCAHINRSFSLVRATHFVELVKTSGHDPHASAFEAEAVYFDQAMVGWGGVQVDRRMKQWLIDLPKPVAIFCATDAVALAISEAAHLLELRIPEDIALLGVNDDPVVCELAYPPISSICVPCEQIGYNAAAMLDRMIETGVTIGDWERLPPTGITTRQSSDMLAHTDERVVASLRFIREHIGRPIQVPDVAAAVGLQRRALEKRFKAALNSTPLDEIRRARVEHAIRLTRETQLPLANVAERCGFTSASRMSKVIRELTGRPPSDYRAPALPLQSHRHRPLAIAE